MKTLKGMIQPRINRPLVGQDFLTAPTQPAEWLERLILEIDSVRGAADEAVYNKNKALATTHPLHVQPGDGREAHLTVESRWE